MPHIFRTNSKRLFILGAVVLLVLLAVLWEIFLAGSFSDTSRAALVKIKTGENLVSVAAQLKEKKLIRSEKLFLLVAQLRGLDTQLQPGRYRLPYGTSLYSLLSTLTENEDEQIKITVPEGFSSYDIDERLTQLSLIESGEFSNVAAAAEGYLFPDTYFVYKRNFDPAILVDRMKENFTKKINLLTKDLPPREGLRPLAEVIIMGSILEKEARQSGDYEKVAGILWKRLDNDWPLQADATLLYGKNSITISKSDLMSDNPYNTRNKKGLPPTPICNPGLAAIKAALLPEETPYWFYLNDSTGKLHYAVTNEEHKKNKAEYIE